MYINIITPCSRPENLHSISQSINIPRSNYRWMVVFDLDQIPEHNLIPENCEVFLHRDPNSCVGHSQRNYAIDLISSGFVYSNDDDTVIHPDLWDNIKDIDDDFISFTQQSKDGSVRLKGDIIELYNIDNHNFIVKRDIIGDSRFIINDYSADGLFAKECYNKSKTKIFIDKPLSVYNFLR